MARSADSSGKDGDPAGRAEIRELSLEEVLQSYEQPINEEQAWAVCFQCCREPGLLIRGPSSIILHRDGTVRAHLDRGGEHLHSREARGEVHAHFILHAFKLYSINNYMIAASSIEL